MIKTFSLFFPIVCEDERTDCYALVVKTGGGQALENYCNRWKAENAIQQCRRTCNLCKYSVWVYDSRTSRVLRENIGESACLPALWPWFDSQWFSTLLRGFFSGSSGFPPSIKTNILNSNSS